MDKLQPALLRNAEFERTIYTVTPEHGTQFEAMLQPKYWANVAYKFKPGDRIEVTAENGEWYAELMVIACARLWAKVAPLRFVELTEAAPAGEAAAESDPANDYKVGWGGNSAKWRVTRESDKQVLRDKFQTREEAESWLKDYLKAVV